MKIGVISDIHNNVIALEKVLEVFRENNCEMVICAGDIIGIGPYPEETVQKVMSIHNLVAVQGNHECYLNDGMDVKKMNKNEYDYHMWEHKLLSNSSKMYIEGLPKEEYVEINNKTIYVAHYGFKESHYKEFTRNTSQSDLDFLFDYIDADVVIYGHDHAPSQVKGKAFYINPGSCGCPGRSKNIARGGILEITDSIIYNQISIEYDDDIVINKIDELNYPAKEEIKKFFFGL